MSTQIPYMGPHVSSVGKRLVGIDAASREPSTGRVVATTTVVPGTEICEIGGLIRGSGTRLLGDGKTLASTIAGRVQQTSCLVTVEPLKMRYAGEVGDVVVGRVVDVQQNRWKVDTNSRLHANLMLASVNLPGGELRRKSAEDELAMSEYLSPGDLISAEIQQMHSDGTMSLHTRSLRYGKLGQGVLVEIPPGLVKRRPSHFVELSCGALVIIGCNGFVWVASIDDSGGADGGYIQNLDEEVPAHTRLVLARVANCIKLLAANSILVYDTTIVEAYELSASLKPYELLIPTVSNQIATALIQKFSE